MQTVTIDILNNKAEKLLQDLEQEQLIRVRREKHQTATVINWATKYKGEGTEQPLTGSQLNEESCERK